jgi:hypothetical protein
MFWGYLAFSGVAGGSLCFAFAFIFTESARKIDAEFYAASAAMLPVLLLALLVRIGRTSDHLIRTRGLLRRTRSLEEEIIGDLEASARELRAEAGKQGHEKSIRQAENQLRSLKDHAEGAETEAISGTEVMFAALLAALAFASAGGGAALVALASGQSTWLTLALTSLALVWLMYSLIAQEIVSFQNAFADFVEVE